MERATERRANRPAAVGQRVLKPRGASCTTAFFPGHLQEAVSFGAQALLATDGTGVLEWPFGLPSLCMGVALVDVDRRVEEDVLLTEPVPNPGDTRHPFHIGLAVGRFHAGEWDEAGSEIEVALSLMQESGLRSGSVWARSTLGLIAVHRGDLRGAGIHVAEAKGDLATAGPQFLADWIWWVRALLHEALNEIEEGARVLRDAWRLCEGAGLISEVVTLGPDLVRMSVIRGEVELAATVATSVEDAASRTDVPSIEGAALRCRGLCERDPDVLMASATAYGRGSRPLERALACEEAANVLEPQRSDEAIVMLGKAVEVYERLGAVRDLARANAALRRLGVRRGRSERHRRAAWGWDSLTSTEREVVRLAAEGLTNAEIGERLFISRRTVETHLSHVFGKVGVSSRVQLAAEAGRRAS
jgi:DNA-binding CsgD family transcriptional regulator